MADDQQQVGQQAFDNSRPKEWLLWLSRFERFRHASGLDKQSQEKQINTLLYAMRPEAESIVRCRDITDDQLKDFDTVKNDWTQQNAYASDMNTKKQQCVLQALAEVLQEEDMEIGFLGSLDDGQGQPWVTHISLCGRSAEFKINMGADLTVIPECLYHDLHAAPPLEKTNKVLQGSSRTPLDVRGRLSATLMTGTKHLDELSPRILRFRMRLMRFHFSISHVPGKSLAKADLLSRAPVHAIQAPESPVEEQLVEGFVHSVISSLPITEKRLMNLKQAQQADELLRQVAHYCQEDDSIYLVMCDYFSQFIEVAKLQSTTSSAVVECMKSWFARNGVPLTVVTDNGPQFSSDTFHLFSRAWNFTHVTSSPLYPQSNSPADRAVQTVKQLFKKSSDPYLAYRSTPLAGGYSPSKLLQRRRLRIPVPAHPSLLQPGWPDLSAFKGQDQQSKLKQKAHFDTRHRAKLLPALSSVAGKPVGILQPNWPQIFSGETVTLRCEIHESGDTAWEYEWNTTSRVSPPDQAEYEIIAYLADRGDYRCRGKLRNDRHTSTEWSAAFTLNVLSQRPKPTLIPGRSFIPVGGSVTLTCSVSGSSEWKYFWYRDIRDTPPLTAEGGLPYSNGTLIISEEGRYWCRGGRGDPVYFTQYSDFARIGKTADNIPIVTRQPNWSQIFSEETVILRCEIHGGRDTEWEYEWRPPNSNFKPSNQHEYRISDVTSYHNGDYMCRGINTNNQHFSTKWSDAFQLSVSSDTPKAVLRADHTVIPVGGSVKLSCSVEGSSGWKYFWYRDNKDSKPLTTGDGLLYSYGAVNVTEVGMYWCRGERGDPVYYTQYSDPVSMNKTVPERAEVIRQPRWSQIFRGETVTLRCQISGGGTGWEYDWRPDSILTPPNQLEYRISNITSYHNGEYKCRGINTNNQHLSTEWSDAFNLSQSYKPKPLLRMSPSWSSPGASVTLNCTVQQSYEGWRFYWFKAVPNQSDGSYTSQLLFGTNSGTAESSLTIHALPHMEGFMCRAGRGDPVYFTEYSQTTFLWSGDRSSSASVTVSSKSTQHFTNESVSLICEGNSTEWRVRSNAEEGHGSQCSSWGRLTTGSTCTINRLATSDSGVYWCESGSGEYSNTVNITVHNSDVILLSPVHPVREGDSLTLVCKHRTSHCLSKVDFYRDNKLIHKGTNDDTAGMVIPALSVLDEGFYKCKCNGTDSPQSWMAVRLSRPQKQQSGFHSFLMWLAVGLVVAVLSMTMTLLLSSCNNSKGPNSDRHIQTEGTFQSLTTERTTNQNQDPEDVTSSLIELRKVDETEAARTGSLYYSAAKSGSLYYSAGKTGSLYYSAGKTGSLCYSAARTGSLYYSAAKSGSLYYSAGSALAFSFNTLLVNSAPATLDTASDCS
ncbi:uncharacterized protein LOC130130964 [Lampris incognitus]|uniref:uncharacterized protein LOC130130964 n=1 Tax=Lampris incognitus TaxID=2546036 RepID=UPI0024B5D8C3|nr:uncharacterized protein LOC130130964 [Lampris incognitus]